MRPNRGLALRKETLAELSPEDLAGVGGQGAQTMPVQQCVSRLFQTCTCCTGTASCEV